jgi:phosphohistidine phosphatase
VKTLFLLRHAKSSWKEEGLADRERPLAPRGRKATGVIAEHLRTEGIVPDLVLCSSAQRTRETLEGIASAFGSAVETEIEDDLYAASSSRLLERLRAVDDGVESVLMIGHNPGIEELAISLAAAGDKLDAMKRKYPTAALATLRFDGSWKELEPGRTELTDFVTPKGLASS